MFARLFLFSFKSMILNFLSAAFHLVKGLFTPLVIDHRAIYRKFKQTSSFTLNVLYRYAKLKAQSVKCKPKRVSLPIRFLGALEDEK